MEGWNNVENETQIFFMKNKNFIRKINRLWKRELLSLNLVLQNCWTLLMYKKAPEMKRKKVFENQKFKH